MVKDPLHRHEAIPRQRGKGAPKWQKGSDSSPGHHPPPPTEALHQLQELRLSFRDCRRMTEARHLARPARPARASRDPR